VVSTAAPSPPHLTLAPEARGPAPLPPQPPEHPAAPPTSPLGGEIDRLRRSGEGARTPETSQANPASPTLSLCPSVTSSLPAADAALLTLFLQLHLNLEALAERTALSILGLLAWADSPPIRATLDALARLRQESLDKSLTAARLQALATLAEIARSSEDPIERRRAATAILRRRPPTQGATDVPPWARQCPAPPAAAPTTEGSPTSPLEGEVDPRSGSGEGARTPHAPFSSSHAITPDSPAPILSQALATLRARPHPTPVQLTDALSPLLHHNVRSHFTSRKLFTDRLFDSGLLACLPHPPSPAPPWIEPNNEHATARVTFHTPQSPRRFTFHFTRNPGATARESSSAAVPTTQGPWRLSAITPDTS